MKRRGFFGAVVAAVLAGCTEAAEETGATIIPPDFIDLEIGNGERYRLFNPSSKWVWDDVSQQWGIPFGR